MKFTVQQVDNGFILKIISYGKNLFSEPYKKDIFVFKNFDEMAKFIKNNIIFKGEKNEKQK